MNQKSEHLNFTPLPQTQLILSLRGGGGGHFKGNRPSLEYALVNQLETSVVKI